MLCFESSSCVMTLSSGYVSKGPIGAKYLRNEIGCIESKYSVASLPA